jgi:DNA-binding protein Fis
VLTPDFLPRSCLGEPGIAETGELTQIVAQLLAEGQTDIYHRVGTVVDRIVLQEVLRHVDGHQQKAAELLGISRMTLRSKLRALGLAQERPQVG